MLKSLYIFLGLMISLSITLVLGENPLEVARILFYGAFGSLTNIGYTLFYATPLIFTGLSVSWGLRAGLFNIGGEGQMAFAGVLMGGLAAHFENIHPIFAIGCVTVGSAVCGFLWGSVAGWLKAYRGCHEVLSTILLNFISYGVVSYLIFKVFKDTSSQIPETLLISENFRLPPLFENYQSSPLNASIFISIGAAILMYLFDRHSVSSFKQRISGTAPRTAEISGLNVKFNVFLNLGISGALAGMASLSDIFGYTHRVREGFTSGAGFVGIAVALLGRNSYMGIVAAAIFFGALHKGSLDLDIDTQNITRDFATLIQALIIVFVASQEGFQKFFGEKILKMRRDP